VRKKTELSLLVALAAMLFSIAAYAGPYRADVIIQSRGHATLVATDRYMPVTGGHGGLRPDGYVDETFTIVFETAFPAVNATITAGDIQVTSDGVIIVDHTAKVRYIFSTAKSVDRESRDGFAESSFDHAYQVSEHDRTATDLTMATVAASAQKSSKRGKVSTMDIFNEDPADCDFFDWWDTSCVSSGGSLPYCDSGGVGCIECTTAIEGGSLKFTCTAKCAAGYYACCNTTSNRCRCYPNP
jgi:hypothetical protein